MANQNSRSSDTFAYFISINTSLMGSCTTTQEMNAVMASMMNSQIIEVICRLVTCWQLAPGAGTQRGLYLLALQAEMQVGWLGD